MNVFELNLKEGEQRKGSMIIGSGSRKKRVKGVLHVKNGRLSFAFEASDFSRGAGDPLQGYSGAWLINPSTSDSDHNSFEPEVITIPPPKFKKGDKVVETKGGFHRANFFKPSISGSIGSENNRNWVVESWVAGDGLWWYDVSNERGIFGNRISEGGLQLVEEAPLKELDGFKVGEMVRIKGHGAGFGNGDVGKIVTITELGRGVYGGYDGARIKEPLGNQKTGWADRWVGLNSFEHLPSDEFLTDSKYDGYTGSINMGDITPKKAPWHDEIMRMYNYFDSISVLKEREGELVDDEVRVEEAKEALDNAKFPTRSISNNQSYVENIRDAQSNVEDYEAALKQTQDSIGYFQKLQAEFDTEAV